MNKYTILYFQVVLIMMLPPQRIMKRIYFNRSDNYNAIFYLI